MPIARNGAAIHQSIAASLVDVVVELTPILPFRGAVSPSGVQYGRNRDRRYDEVAENGCRNYPSGY